MKGIEVKYTAIITVLFVTIYGSAKTALIKASEKYTFTPDLISNICKNDLTWEQTTNGNAATFKNVFLKVDPNNTVVTYHCTIVWSPILPLGKKLLSASFTLLGDWQNPEGKERR